MSGEEFPTFAVEGVPVVALDLASACDFIGQHAPGARGQYITVTGAHGIVEAAHAERIRNAHQQALMVVPDGMPLVWLGRLLGYRAIGRVYGPDIMQAIFAKEQYRGLKHFFYGSTPFVVAKLVAVLQTRFGEFNLVGTHCPPQRPLGFIEDSDVLTRIRDLKPDLIWVGLSTPKQELWMQMHMPNIGSGMAIGVGAAFELVSGTIVQAPRWIRHSGLEWLFRLLMEPRRLFRRYLFIVPQFLYFMVKTLAKNRTAAWTGLGRRKPI
jgi:N-acetylglucosaminyldiphosphoundecaprenol N-acetyl-beta-D-mannosaminyltransferase